MSITSSVVDALASPRFGWPKPKRLEEFAALHKGENLPTFEVTFQNRNQDLPKIRVPIELPKYRLQNGRTASLQVEYLARHPAVRRDLFTGDSEMWDAQEAQHNLLVDLGRQSDLDKYFSDPSNVQVGAIVLDEHGFVVNGNRRLAAWRQLLHDQRSKFSHFQHIDVVVLPHATEAEIDRLEARLQIERDIRADYPWDAQANMMIAKMQRDGLTPAELCHLYKMKDTELQELLDMRAYADEYLKSRGKADMWSEVSGHGEHTFRRLIENRVKVPGVARQELFKEAVFALIDDPSTVGRLYIAIPELAANLGKVVERLSSELAEDRPAVPDDGLDALFGDGSSSPQVAEETALTALLKDTAALPRAREIIGDVLESERQLKKDVKKAGYLLDVCAKANAALTAAVKDGLRPESKLVGVAAQLDEIEARMTAIRAFLAQHAKT